MSTLQEPDDDRTQPFVVFKPGTKVSHYQIISSLGAGGMGEVYLAQDSELDRRVALKFLSPHLCQVEDCRARFKREAQAAAKLDHPNVVTIYEVGDLQSRPFFAMQHVEGKSLREYARTKKLEPGEIIDLAEQICEGLGAAHEKNVVHRDIKPSNIVIDSRGRAKILDFGLAAIQDTEHLTKTGSTLGTVRYMSPEQVQGLEVDYRSDLFSFGVVLYELITGRSPFARDNDIATGQAIIHSDPDPISRLEPGMSGGLDQVVNRLLEKDVGRRYQSAAEVIRDLRQFNRPVQTEESDQRSIAVLPFTNRSADESQEYFCDGIAEDIINDLTQLGDLRVAARTSSFAFKGKIMDVRDIASKLSVTTILEGSVRKIGNRLRITAQLINAADGYQVWSQRFDRTMDDVFEVQDEIAESVARALTVEPSSNERMQIVKRYTDDVLAYDLYLKGRELSRQAKKYLYYAVDMFIQAIERDPNYALAYADLADCYSGIYLYHDHVQSNMEKSREMSRKALELDPDLAEAHSAVGFSAILTGDYETAEREFEIALKTNPRLFVASYNYARTCFAQGKLEQAAELFERASEADPEDYQAVSLVSTVYRGMGQEKKATAMCWKAIEIIERRLKLHPDDARAVYLGANNYLELGERDKAREWIERAIAMDPSDSGILYNASCVYSNLGELDKSMEYLTEAIHKGFGMKEWIEHDPDLKPLRELPAFQELLAHLDEAFGQ